MTESLAMAQWSTALRAVRLPGVEGVSLAIGRPPQAHRRGRLIPLGRTPLTPDQTMALVEAITPPLAMRRLLSLGEAIFEHVESDGTSVQVHICRFRGRVGLVMRCAGHSLPPEHNPEED
ncbi:hypothetical protein JXA47_15075 [Candidatus Sumerlaeota bacterium]|nr:hypothetical protein [Candidatus Sumerlaeota bacterium]